MGGYIGDYIEDYHRVIKGDTRSLDYSSTGCEAQWHQGLRSFVKSRTRVVKIPHEQLQEKGISYPTPWSQVQKTQKLTRWDSFKGGLVSDVAIAHISYNSVLVCSGSQWHLAC